MRIESSKCLIKATILKEYDYGFSLELAERYREG